MATAQAPDLAYLNKKQVMAQLTALRQGHEKWLYSAKKVLDGIAPAGELYPEEMSMDEFKERAELENQCGYLMDHLEEATNSISAVLNWVAHTKTL